MWRERGDRLIAQRKIDEAIDCLRKAVERAPASRDLHIDLVRALVLAGRGDEVDGAEGWNGLGYCLLDGSRENLARAEQAFQTALRQSPKLFEAFLGLSECLARQRRLDEAQAARDTWFRHWIEDAASEKLRRQQQKARDRGIPAIMFVAMMKSASEFIRENLMRALDVPEIAVSIGTVPWDKVTAAETRQLAKGGAIARSHMSADNLPVLVANGIERLILQVRDPRQVIISWVHHMRRISDVEFRWMAPRYDPPVPADFARWEFRRQIDWAVDNYLPGQVQWLEDWASVLADDSGMPVFLSTFEEFVRDQPAFFARLSDFLGISEVGLPDLRRQSAAAMRNFRAGSTEEWREVLTADQKNSIQSRIEPLARRFGWNLDAAAWSPGTGFGRNDRETASVAGPMSQSNRIVR